MYQAILKTILTSLDNPLSESFKFDDVCHWPKHLIALLESTKVFVRAPDVSTVICDGCEKGCVEQVEMREDENGGVASYIVCQERDDIGRVMIEPQRLKTWKISMNEIAKHLSRAFGSSPQQFLFDRLWMVGEVETSSGRIDIFLARGIGWPDGESVIERVCSHRRSRTAVLLTPTLSRPCDHLEFVLLDEVLQLGRDVLSVNMSRIQRAADRAIDSDVRQYRYLFKEGVDTWTIVYDGIRIDPPLKNSKGLKYIAFFLAHPFKKYSSTDVVYEVEGLYNEPDESVSRMSEEEIELNGLRVVDCDYGTGEIMDEAYEKDCRNKLIEAQNDLRRAEASHDVKLIEDLKHKIECYRIALSEGIGLGGRHRVSGKTSEKSRCAIRKAVSRALKKIKLQHPALYDHLSASLRTGTFCAYEPTNLVDWHF